MNRITKAYRFACEAHKGQLRKCGSPFIEHPVRVALSIMDDIHIYEMEMIFSDMQRRVIVALLHDVIEDTHHTKQSLTDAGFGDVVDDICALSRRSPQDCEACAQQWEETHKVSVDCTKDCQTHWDYIRSVRDYAIKEYERCGWCTSGYMDHTVMQVKVADIEDNMVTAEQVGPTMRERYEKSLDILRNPNT